MQIIGLLEINIIINFQWNKIKNRINYKIGIYGDFEKVKFLFGFFKRFGKSYDILNIKVLFSFNSFDGLCSQFFLFKIKMDES